MIVIRYAEEKRLYRKIAFHRQQTHIVIIHTIMLSSDLWKAFF